jgi:Transcriptional regulator
MCGRRESKKAATRALIARATATLALTNGLDTVTVSAITEASGVSRRTFHNYFASREEALSAFVSDRINELAERMHAVPSDTPITVAVEDIAVEALDIPPSEPDSFLSLMRLRMLLDSVAPSLHTHTVVTSLGPVIDELCTLYPERSPLEVRLLLQLSVTTATVAVETHFAEGGAGDRRSAEHTVRRAFDILRHRTGV